MPQQRELSYYGNACWRILSSALEKERKIPFPSEAQASTYRRTLYNYRYALRDASRLGDEEAKERYKVVMQVSMFLYGDTLVVTKRQPTIVQKAETHVNTTISDSNIKQ